ncbi:hypothetical protein D9M71_590750 [compost metagenome]
MKKRTVSTSLRSLRITAFNPWIMNHLASFPHSPFMLAFSNCASVVVLIKRASNSRSSIAPATNARSSLNRGNASARVNASKSELACRTIDSAVNALRYISWTKLRRSPRKISSRARRTSWRTSTPSLSLARMRSTSRVDKLKVMRSNRSSATQHKSVTPSLALAPRRLRTNPSNNADLLATWLTSRPI